MRAALVEGLQASGGSPALIRLKRPDFRLSPLPLDYAQDLGGKAVEGVGRD